MAAPMFHINDDDEVMSCTARKKPCQFKKESSDGKDNHYGNLADAYKGLSKRFDEKDILAGMKRLSPKGKKFIVENGGGDYIKLHGGTLDRKAKHVFNNGQCLALASEISKSLGSNQVVIISEEVSSEELLVDEKGEIVFDEYGDEIEATEDIIFHAYGVSQDGKTLYDASGPIPANYLEKSYENDKNYQMRYYTINDAQNEYSGDMSEQNYEFAATFTDEITKIPLSAAYKNNIFEVVDNKGDSHSFQEGGSER